MLCLLAMQVARCDMWQYALVYGVVSPVMVGWVSPSVCTADVHGRGAVCSQHRLGQLLKTCSLSLFYSPFPRFILTMEVAAPENVYTEVAAPKQVAIASYIRLRQEENVNMIWCGVPVLCFLLVPRCRPMHVACGHNALFLFYFYFFL